MRSNKKSNRIIWGIVSLVVLTTLAISFGTMSSHSQRETSKEQDKSPFGDLGKYAVADYNAPEPENAAEREERKLKNKRYDKYLLVLRNPHPEATASFVTDGEPLSPAIPFAESRLIVIGEVLDSEASLSNDKTGVYSEYSVRIQTILKEDKQKKLQTGEIITMDRTGGIVRYPNGQKMFYLMSWQDLPEVKKHYVIFLNKDDDQNPNYRILTAYQLKSGNVTALDRHFSFREFNGMSETDFIKLILSKNNRRQEQ